MSQIKLRTYQEEAISKINNFFIDKASVMLVSPTGAGKSVMAKEIAKKYKKVLFVAHRKELLDQFRKITYDKPYEFTTIQSAHKTFMNNYDLIIVDECHHIVTKSYLTLLAEHKKAKFLGLTATPQRLDGQPLKEIFDAIVETVGTKTLQKSGYLVPALEYSVGQKLNLSRIKKTAGDYNVKSLGIKVRKTILFGDVYKEYMKYAERKKALAYCVDIKHANDMAQYFNSHGIKACSLNGCTKNEVRSDVMHDFTYGDTQIITNCMLFTEGIDIPSIECIIMLRPTLSLGLYLQMAGRGLRKDHGKDSCIILDHANNHETHGTVNSDRTWQYETRLRAYNSSGGHTMYPSFINNIITMKGYNLIRVRKPTPIFGDI
jgi:superfamily II DNA or RNA helicase